MPVNLPVNFNRNRNFTETEPGRSGVGSSVANSLTRNSLRASLELKSKDVERVTDSVNHNDSNLEPRLENVENKELEGSKSFVNTRGLELEQKNLSESKVVVNERPKRDRRPPQRFNF